jgi:glycine/D-amino acid oxidase-like deaminating enzyme
MMHRLAPAVTRSVLPLEVYEMATDPLDKVAQRRLLPDGHVVSDTRNTVFSYHLDCSGRLLTGSITPPVFGAVERVQREGERHIRERLRLKLDTDIAFVWHGTITRLLDSLPRLFEVAPGVVAPIACNGRGIAKTTAVGRLCADLAAGTDAADLALPLTPPRPIPLHGFLAWLHPYIVSLSALQDHLTP